MTINQNSAWTLDLGANVVAKGVQFKVWAPLCRLVEVSLESDEKFLALDKSKNGYFEGLAKGLSAGARYKYRLNKKDSFPDPCSRFQPQGPHGPSMVIDPNAYSWKDHSWQKKGVELKGQVIYELHVGAFTQDGTYESLQKRLDYLKELGITTLEIMPLHEFPGRWNWGYDGVGLFAPAHVYGTPDQLRSMIDYAHQIGLSVILDVVYNHFGPDGNYLKCFSSDYFAPHHVTDWGEAVNFYGTNAAHSRHFFIQNACYWIKEFHFDGLRLDATQNIYDISEPHILKEISISTRRAAFPKKIILIAENESQDVRLIDSTQNNGYGLDGMWNDDFHHAASVALTGRREAYYTDYLGTPQEFISSLKYGFLYQGQYYTWQKQNRGSVYLKKHLGMNLINFLENHDQVANSLHSMRLEQFCDAGSWRALSALLLLSPQTPLLFMGQEYAASQPFYFFADHHADLAKLVHTGRRQFLSQFPSYTQALEHVPDPAKEETFQACKLLWQESPTQQKSYFLYRDLIKLRREDAVIAQQDDKNLEGSVLGSDAFCLRFFGKNSDRLLIINLGKDMDYTPSPEPLLAPPSAQRWSLIWSSEDAKYGGNGIVSVFTEKGCHLPARSAYFFSSQPIQRKEVGHARTLSRKKKS